MKGPPSVEVHDEHSAIYEAALARNADMTGALLTAHIHRALKVISKEGLLR